MNESLTPSEARALRAVSEGRVERIYRANGNAFRPPKGVGHASLRHLEAKRLIRDGRGERGGYNTICPVVLTATGISALTRVGVSP